MQVNLISKFGPIICRTCSVDRKRTLLKVKIGFFFCLRSLLRGNPMQNNLLMVVKFVFHLQINRNITFWQSSSTMGMGFDKFPSVRRPLWCTFPPVFSVGGHPAYYSLASASRNNSRKRTTNTFPNSRGCPLTSSSRVDRILIALKKNSRHKLVF